MVIAILPMQSKTTMTAYNHGEYYYSEQAMGSMANGIDRGAVEAFIDANMADGDYAVVDDSKKLFLKYSITGGQVTVYLIEKID
jgi:hypothetical protein